MPHLRGKKPRPIFGPSARRTCLNRVQIFRAITYARFLEKVQSSFGRTSWRGNSISVHQHPSVGTVCVEGRIFPAESCYGAVRGRNGQCRLSAVELRRTFKTA